MTTSNIKCVFFFYFARANEKPTVFLLQNETLLCKRFTAYVLKYDLMAKENLIVPMDEASPSPPPPEDPKDDGPVDSET